MLNQFITVGRVAKIETKEESAIMTIEVSRNYKNYKGEYEVDIFPIRLFKGVAESTVEWVHKGELVGVKGRIQTKDNQIIMIGEKVTFLTTKNTRKEEE